MRVVEQKREFSRINWIASQARDDGAVIASGATQSSLGLAEGWAAGENWRASAGSLHVRCSKRLTGSFCRLSADTPHIAMTAHVERSLRVFDKKTPALAHQGFM